MGSIEERVAYLEGRAGDEADTMVDFRMAVDDLRSGLRDVRADMAALRADLRSDLTALRTEARIEVGGVRDEVRESRTSAERRFDQMDGRLLHLDGKHDRQFMWLAGLQVASLITVAGALLGAYLR